MVLSQAQIQIRKMKILSNDKRRAIYKSLLLKSVDGKLKQGVTKMVASQFLVSMRTIQRIWKQSKSNDIHVDVSHKRTRNYGRKRVQIDLTQIPEIPLRQRTTLASLACSMNTNKVTLFRLLKSGAIR